VKVLASAEKIGHYLQYGEELESVNGEEAVYEMGLLMLDVVHGCECKADSQLFSKDQPLSRARIHQGYLIFSGDAQPTLNSTLINQKTKFLQGKGSLVDRLLHLIQRMIADKSERISL
jgi:hypothetical protein